MANNDIFLHCVKESFARGGGITPINNYINASATVFVNDISHELTLDSNYTSDYAIESANDNGIHVLPIECQYLRQCLPRHCMYADLHYLNYPLDYQAGKQW